MQTLCPHCKQPIRVSVTLPVTQTEKKEFDPADSVQIRGYEDAQYNDGINDGKRKPEEFKKCPWTDGQDEFYRYNRGMWAFWNGVKL